MCTKRSCSIIYNWAIWAMGLHLTRACRRNEKRIEDVWSLKSSCKKYQKRAQINHVDHCIFDVYSSITIPIGLHYINLVAFLNTGDWSINLTAILRCHFHKKRLYLSLSTNDKDIISQIWCDLNIRNLNDTGQLTSQCQFFRFIPILDTLFTIDSFKWFAFLVYLFLACHMAFTKTCCNTFCS